MMILMNFMMIVMRIKGGEKLDKLDKLALKKKLYQDKEDITRDILDTNDIVEKSIKRQTLDLINSYIEICIKRNKF